MTTSASDHNTTWQTSLTCVIQESANEAKQRRHAEIRQLLVELDNGAQVA
jgi:hypothetical protein